jgi:predicted metalloprotease
MRWQRSGRSDDLIDVRGSSSGGRRGGLPMAGGGLGLAGVVIVVLLQVLGGGSGGGFQVPGAFDPQAQAQGSEPLDPAQDPDRELAEFSHSVFTRANDMWEKTFTGAGKSYERAKLVLYRQGVQTGCGSASSAVGPFYCPADRRVYLDLSFYGDMKNQLNADGDFAWAYVIAHEVGHHIQRISGTEEAVRREQRDNPDSQNELSVRMELQADCYAGVFGHAVFEEGDLQDGDIEEAMTASQAVGDDRLQQQNRGQVDPDSFTHGTSAQRLKWFKAGQDAGEPARCDTFSVDNP